MLGFPLAGACLGGYGSRHRMMKLILVNKIWSRRRCLGLMAGLLISFCSLPVGAADADDQNSTNQDQRPIEELFKTDTVFPQEAGELEIELAPLYQNNAGGDTFTAPVSLEYGLTSRWQVEAEWDSYVQHLPAHGLTTRGIGDLELGTQYSFMNLGGSLFHLAARFSVELPLGDVNQDLSEGFVEYEPAVILARDFPELHHTQVFTEVGASLVQRVKSPADEDDAEPAAHELNLGAGFFTQLPLGTATFEFNWNDNEWNHHGTENELYVTPGWLWKPVKNIELGAGIPVGLNRQSDRYELAAHIVYEF